MARYIDADEFEKAYNAMLEFSKKFCGLIKPNILDLLNQAPTADVQEVKHGYWIPERDPDENNRIQCYHCSICDDDFHYIGAFIATKYCPNCGARMDGDSSDG